MDQKHGAGRRMVQQEE
jgi:hypothetical protein